MMLSGKCACDVVTYQLSDLPCFLLSETPLLQHGTFSLTH